LNVNDPDIIDKINKRKLTRCYLTI